MVVGKIPVFMRVGDNPEHEIGTIDLEGEVLPGGAPGDGAHLVLKPLMLAGFFRAAAEAAEAADAR